MMSKYIYRLNHSIFNSLPQDKILDWFKLKAFADNNISVAKMMISPCDRVENNVGRGENSGYKYTFFSHDVFKRLIPQIQ